MSRTKQEGKQYRTAESFPKDSWQRAEVARGAMYFEIENENPGQARHLQERIATLEAGKRETGCNLVTDQLGASACTTIVAQPHPEVANIYEHRGFYVRYEELLA